MIEKIAEFMGWEGTISDWRKEKDKSFAMFKMSFDPLHDWNHWKKIVEPRIHEKGMWGTYIHYLWFIVGGEPLPRPGEVAELIMSADPEQRAQALMRVLEGMDVR